MSKTKFNRQNTQICTVIGNPISHSLSPKIHNAAFEELGLNFIYTASKIENVKSALEYMRGTEKFRGMSVTIPHKIEAMKYVDNVAEIDRTIGSINTVINENGKLFGFSTDGPGALKAFVEAGVTIDGKKILILGSGGAARAISFTLALKTKVQELYILDVNETMLKQLTGDLETGTDVLIKSDLLSENSFATAMENVDIIIHCTPIGMFPNVDASIIPAKYFKPHQVVFDIVYTPFETKLLLDAKSRGLRIIHGLEMFINQAVLQFERFTGVDAPVKVMRQVLMEQLKNTSK
jgi:shikimate dehydrogenase